jgi:GAF domain-containing protein
MGEGPQIADALATAARDINAPRDLESTLDAIVRVAARSLPGIDHAGISIAHRGGQIETKAGTDPLVWDLDALQQALGEGPSVHAVASQQLTVVDDLRNKQRWPRYVAGALEHGLKAQLGIRLHVEDETLGSLNLYSTEKATIHPEVVHSAELFATHAALALCRARREEELTAALHSGRVIGMALGLVMERFSLDHERAFDYLTRISQQSNTKLRDIAQEMVENAEHRARREDSPAR